MVLYLEQYLHRRGFRDRTELIYFPPYPAVFDGDRFVEIAGPIIEERGIQSALNFTLKQVKDSTLHSQEGESLEFDLAVAVPPLGAGRPICDTGLADDGWVDVDPHTFEVTGQENMFALGDIAEIDCPMTGVAAHAQAKSVVDGVLAGVRGRGASAALQRPGHVLRRNRARPRHDHEVRLHQRLAPLAAEALVPLGEVATEPDVLDSDSVGAVLIQL